MLILIPAEITNLRRVGVQAKPVANLLLILANISAFLVLSPADWAVGPHSAPWTVVTYAFVDVGWWHMLLNVWYLWVFGNPINRRIGNGYYLAMYLGTVILLGVVARGFASGANVGASGEIFAIIAMTGLMMPAARVNVHYMALFPTSLVIGCVHRPKHWLFWFVCWGTTDCRALWLCAIYPALEVWPILWSGLSWTTLGHLGGFACGVAMTVVLPTTISMGRRTSYLGGIAGKAF